MKFFVLRFNIFFEFSKTFSVVKRFEKFGSVDFCLALGKNPFFLFVDYGVF